jgi:hypothetical protein
LPQRVMTLPAERSMTGNRHGNTRPYGHELTTKSYLMQSQVAYSADTSVGILIRPFGICEAMLARRSLAFPAMPACGELAWDQSTGRDRLRRVERPRPSISNAFGFESASAWAPAAMIALRPML